MKAFLEWLLLGLAILQFVHEGLPPGNSDLISVQSLAIDLSHHEVRFLYPGYGFAQNDEWVAHHEENLRKISQPSLQPNWCFYPPLVPFVLSLLAGATVEAWRMVWGGIQLALIFVFAELIIRLLVNSGAVASPKRVLIYALVIGSAPVARSVVLGQTSLLIAVLLWLGVYARLIAKRIPAAIAIGTAIFVKPFLLLSEIPLLVRRRIGAVIASVAVAVALMAISLIAVGIPAHVEYVNLLRTLSTSQTAFSGNQSLYAGLLRLFSSLPVTDYGFQFDPGMAVIGRWIAVLVIAVAFYAQWKCRTANILFSTGLWISASLLALPISWEHHLLFLLPTLAFLWTLEWSGTGFAAVATTTIFICVSLSAFYGESSIGRIAASAPLLGDLILFVLLVTLHVRPHALMRVHV